MRARLFVGYHTWEHATFRDLSKKERRALLRLRHKLLVSQVTPVEPFAWRGLRVTRPIEGHDYNEKRPRKTEPSSPNGAGNEIRTHDFNLGNTLLAPNTIREVQQHQPHSVPCAACRPVVSPGKWKVEWKVWTCLLGRLNP